MTLTEVQFGTGPLVSTKCPHCSRHATTIQGGAAGYVMAHGISFTSNSGYVPVDAHMWTVETEMAETPPSDAADDGASD